MFIMGLTSRPALTPIDGKLRAQPHSELTGAGTAEIVTRSRDGVVGDGSKIVKAALECCRAIPEIRQPKIGLSENQFRERRSPLADCAFGRRDGTAGPQGR
jgi:hypothetical protein